MKRKNRKQGSGSGENKSGSGDNENTKEENKFKKTLGEAIVTDKPNVKWTDVAGLEKEKKALQEAVILPIKYPDAFKGARKPWKGILLYGVNK